MHSTASAHTSPVKEGRRILGEKTANACLSPRHASLSPTKRPLLEVPSSTTTTSPSKKLLPSPLFAGHKRTIDEVDGAIEHASTTSRERALGPAPLPLANHAQDELTPEVSAPSVDILSQADATLSPEGEGLDLETQQHEHHEEDVEQQIPTPARPAKTTTTTTQQQQQITPPTTTRPILEDPATRKRFIQEKATLLRTRLQTAKRHVRDSQQFDRRLSELEAHSRKCPRLSLPPKSQTQAPAQAQIPAPKDSQRMVAAAAAAAAAATGGSTAGPKTPAPAAAALAPISTPCPLQPRAPELNTSPDNLADAKDHHASGLSSPPLSTGNEASAFEDEEDPMKTPTQKMYRPAAAAAGGEAASPMQLSSPPATVSRRRTGTGALLEDKDEGMSLPEKQRRVSQKGDAVDGLLKLMGTVEQQQQQQQPELVETRTG
ncbi:uncharacterized protein BP01DRAFT_426419 [Aspergillus saccharolyticus JOP 1030-1]|uniref:Uncharacterized protein n=1 Tax=Aspergillus saccharolyticus JOP 1030-1 TaxID=1450539 RepID=A0A318Z2X0_9EURO|nr:hypothetical protein BP01DRAFT_426419 [Aspergillus saccharolyticus JOP 1030-1]PYH41349.1 hypothetical protein BP01DRAFT_426419 [Aspergillus saccharolyticus JOP 1030-1]